MMKNFILISLSLFSNQIFSQEYTSKIAKETCECIQKAKTENPDPKKLELQFGMCMINASQPYAKEIKRDFNVDLLSGDSYETGEVVGKWLLKECPDAFMDLVNSSNEEAEEKQMLVNGTVSKIEEERFITFHIVGENKILNKFYWISNIESNLDLPKVYKTLLNKKITVSYFNSDIFDPKINDYRNLNIISTLKTD